MGCLIGNHPLAIRSAKRCPVLAWRSGGQMGYYDGWPRRFEHLYLCCFNLCGLAHYGIGRLRVRYHRRGAVVARVKARSGDDADRRIRSSSSELLGMEAARTGQTKFER
jgi:hypothetical protein